MGSSTAFPSSRFIASERPSFLPRRSSCFSSFTSPTSFVSYRRSSNSRILHISASLLHSNVDVSWFPPDPNSLPNNYGGWAVVQAPLTPKTNKKGLSSIFVGSLIGSSLAIAISISYLLFYKKGFKFQFRGPLNTFHEFFSWRETKDDQTEARHYLESDEQAAETTPDHVSVAVTEAVPSAPTYKHERIVVPVAVDSTQQEALSILKKLKIIEDEERADELCTRREYARWLVRTSSLLERNPRHRIVPCIALSGSETLAFDDIGANDPDFESIQALAEAGIIPSKLSGRNTASDGSKGEINFYPDQFISREDLINWKALVEYDFEPGVIEQISRTEADFMDLKEISPDSSPGLFIDMLAGEKRQIKRFQSNKPSTKAQVAVALTSGRMAEAISNELLKLEMESCSKRAQMKEIKSELLEKGEIQRFWNERLDEERTRGFEVEKLYFSAVQDVEEEKIVQEKCGAEFLKEKAAMDCQRQLVLSLKEHSKLQDTLTGLRSKQEEIIDAKSILEAEIEAIKILRSWVEDEARKSQARAKVLEEVGRRWKWDDQA
ncbi:hypothetical protein GOBAR_AA35964 [Gossypium barbadense]|uniref:SLH domain-containing protein n=1 Tax=Gossypium barbadense TaxID=3634 RepID=A0A2P5W0Y5_GOSBA|nr:hypothetical protein GOBAR_AA35964 [Gossypium barbadense]